MLITLGLIQGKLEEAIPLLQQVKTMSEVANGTEHPDFALKLNNLAELLRDQVSSDLSQLCSVFVSSESLSSYS